MLLAVIVLASAPLAPTEGRGAGTLLTLARPFDTTLDRRVPGKNFGREPILRGGPDRAILVRFPIGPELLSAGTASSAVLRLVPVSEGDFALKSVHLVRQPWEEGGGRGDLPGLAATTGGGATWDSSLTTERRTDWAVPGAGGGEPLATAQAVCESGVVSVVGLAEAVRGWQSDPAVAYGLRLEFAEPCEFWSADSGDRGPRLELVLAGDPIRPPLAVSDPIPTDGGWATTVENVAAPVGPLTVSWRLNGREVATQTLPSGPDPGDSVTVTSPIPLRPSSDPRADRITVTAAMGGAARSAEAFPYGLPVRPRGGSVRAGFDGSDLVRTLNDRVFAVSRASFAPGGCRERARLAVPGEPALELDFGGLQASTSPGLVARLAAAVGPFGELGWLAPGSPATVSGFWDDSPWPPGIPLPATPGGAVPSHLPSLPENPLSLAQVAWLEATVGMPLPERANWRPETPAAAILRVVDDSGQGIAGARVEVRVAPATGDGDKPTLVATTTERGSLFLPGIDGAGPFGRLRPDGSNSWMRLTVQRDRGVGEGWLSAQTLIAERARGNSAPTVEVRVPVSSGPIRSEPDLARGRPVADSGSRPPAALAPVIDGDPGTSVPFTGPGWVEVDLGRDRVVGEVRLVFRPGPRPASLRVRIRSTGAPTGTGRVWAQFRGIGGDESLRAVATEARHVRLEWDDSSTFELASLEVRGVESPTQAP